MTMTDAQKLSDILSLPPQRRLEIAAAIWDSLADAPETVPIPPWHTALIAERLAEDEAAKEPGLSWDEARRRIEGSA